MPPGRPSLPLGTAGSISWDVLPGGRFRARTRVRDYDGRTRQLSRIGTSKGAATNALKMAVRDRHVGQVTHITPDTRVEVVAEAWWAEYRVSGASPNTLRLYRDRLDRQIIPSLGGLRMREVTVGVVDRHIQTVAQRHGPGLARSTRAVLSNICRYAARNDALDRNVVRDASAVRTKRKDRVWDALSVPEALDLRIKVGLDDQAVLRDIPDLIDMLLATGLRIGEVCAIEWDDVDLDKATVRVGDAMVVRERGKGLYIRREESNKLKKRTLELPDWAVRMLRIRNERVTGTLVFPSPKGQLRDPSNTSSDIRDALANAGFEGATSHLFRRTLATWMDESGLSARAAADQLGHAKINMTQNQYFARHRGSTGAKQLLDKMIVTEEPE